MNSKEIIKDAWRFTQANKSMMKWYALMPSIVSTLAGVLFLMYQYFSFRKTTNANGDTISVTQSFLRSFWDFLTNNPSSIWYLIGIGLLAVFFYLFYPTFAQGAMIKLIAKKRQGEEAKLVHGITYGLGSFLPMFEYHLVIRSFSLTAVIAETTFVLRNLGNEFLNFLLPIFILIGIAGLFLTLYFTFVEWFIAIDEERVFSSMQKSASLVFRNWQHTFLILILLFVIGIRVVVNMIFVFVIPLLIFAGIGLFATVAFQNFALIIALGIGLIALYLAGYLGGTLSVFSHAVWTFVFLELTGKTKEEES